jgi:hypothetical protein
MRQCAFYKGKMIVLLYENDDILWGFSSNEIDDIITSLKDGFNFTDEGEIND